MVLPLKRQLFSDLLSRTSADRIRELARAFSDSRLGPGRTLAVGGGIAVSGADATDTQIAIAILNYLAGNIGTTVLMETASVWNRVSAYAELLELSDAMRAGEIEILIIQNLYKNEAGNIFVQTSDRQN